MFCCKIEARHIVDPDRLVYGRVEQQQWPTERGEMCAQLLLAQILTSSRPTAKGRPADRYHPLALELDPRERTGIELRENMIDFKGRCNRCNCANSRQRTRRRDDRRAAKTVADEEHRRHAGSVHCLGGDRPGRRHYG